MYSEEDISSTSSYIYFKVNFHRLYIRCGRFTKEPQNLLLVVEGDNITLEWEYTFGESESFFFLTIVKGNLAVVTKLLSTLSIQTSYQGRLHANITDSYASVTLLGVNRLEMGSYTLRVSSQPDGESNSSTVEISVLCKYK